MEASTATIPPLLQTNIGLLTCPTCGGDLRLVDGVELSCEDCDRTFASDSGIPLLFWPNDWQGKTDVTEIVKAFYEETPFPNYDGVDTAALLRQKADSSMFAKLVDEQLPAGAKILEAGCGTGQFSNYLGMRWGRTVFGTDICLNSLRLGQRFKIDNEIENVAFVQMNLFQPAFKAETFDAVICNGVLHHTSDPELGFRSLAQLVAPGGHIIIGLYNRWGRIPTNIRRTIFKLSGNRLQFLDSRLRDQSIDETRRHTWFMDQYKHPHESKHTIGQVLRWFDRAGFDFVHGIPKPTPFSPFMPDEPLFTLDPAGGAFDHFLVQGNMLAGGGKEGGFFVMIGKKRQS
jgi:SAM-dependent methyltransferase